MWYPIPIVVMLATWYDNPYIGLTGSSSAPRCVLAAGYTDYRMSTKRFPYGGQAVLEGVMMRGLHQATIAVRRSSGEIVFKHEPLNVRRRHAWEHLPFLRGILML